MLTLRHADRQLIRVIVLILAAAACTGCGGAKQTYSQAPTSSTPGAAASATISGHVWLDAGHSQTAIAGVAVDLQTPSGARSVATNSAGRFQITAPAGVALTLEIPVLQDDLQKLKPSPPTPRSPATDTGDLDELAIAPLHPGAQLTGRDFDFQALSASS